MRIALIGASGHLGKSLLRDLLIHESSIQIQIIRYSQKSSVELDRYVDYFGPSRLKCINYQELECDQPNLEIFDCVLFVGSWIPDDSITDSDSTLSTALSPAKSFLSLLERFVIKTRKMIYISSAAVYGNKGIFNQNSKTNPEDLYGQYKLILESNFATVCKKLGIPIEIVRPTLIFGPGEVIPRLTTRLMNYLISDEPFDIKGAQGLRNYIYISDVVDYLKFLVFSPSLSISRIHNLGSSEIFTIKFFVETALQAAENLGIYSLRSSYNPTFTEFGSSDFVLEPNFNIDIDFRPRKLSDNLHEYLSYRLKAN